jgi:lysophospholipid acyltransferase (LPLAT)-like uncharacterized protein
MTGVLVSESLDGDLQARVLRAFGFVVFRGSSSRGGDRGARALLRHLRAGYDVAIALDGPRGPALVEKPGAAWLARVAPATVWMLSVTRVRGWVLQQTWDRFAIPFPGTRVELEVAEGVPCGHPENTPTGGSAP